MEYRIKEHLGRFKIQVKKETIKTTGYLWWKKREMKTEWVNANERGEPFWFDSFIGCNPPPCESFKTLEEAMTRVEIFNAPPKYHLVKTLGV